VPDAEIRIPPGFPKGYHWKKGDWLCPSPGCEGYVTESTSRNCIHCARSQPHFITLMALARNERYRTGMCDVSSCSRRSCENAHAVVELRDYSLSRVYREPSNKSTLLIPPSVTDPEIEAFVLRWKIQEPGTSVLMRLPGPLGDLVNRQFMVSDLDVPDSSLTSLLMKCIADMTRAQTLMVHPKSLSELLRDILRYSAGPIGIACSPEGHLGIALEKEVMLLQTKEFSTEDLGLLAFAISFSGIAVVQFEEDLVCLRSAFPKIYSDMFDRVRQVDNPSELLHVASDPFEAVTDRATQAKCDAMVNSAPLLPTPSPTET
jgi:hypothetical protein